MKITLRGVVIGALAIGLLVPSVLGVGYIAKSQAAKLKEANIADHVRITEILALGVEKALWDLAPEGAIPLVKSAMQDDRLVSARITDTENAVFHEEVNAERKKGSILKQTKEVTKDGKAIGKVEVEFSLDRAESEIVANVTKTLIISSIQILVCVFLLSSIINRRIVERIKKIMGQAQKLARKELSETFQWQPTDEIGELGVSLETTRGSLQKLFADLEEKNKELGVINANLEGLVAERTAAIRTILDHVQSGFLLIDRNVKILDGYSKSCETLFGTATLQGQPLLKLMGLNDRESGNFQCCLDQVFEDIFPEEVSLGQMPGRFHRGDKTYSIEGRGVRNATGVLEKILFTIVDVSELERSEQENKRNRAIILIMQNLRSFQEFVQESHVRLKNTSVALKNSDERTARMELHTLKGGSASFGLDAIAQLIHHIEDETTLTAAHVSKIHTAFEEFLSEHYPIFNIRFGAEPVESFAITKDQLAALGTQIVQSTSLPAAQSDVHSWMHDIRKVAFSELVGPLKMYVERFAEQHHKAVRFETIGLETRVLPDQLRAVGQNLIHLLRNAIDHGIESSEERGEKSATASIKLECVQEAHQLKLRICDDGRGIDPERVLAKAARMGLNTIGMNANQAIQLIFADGLSTAEQVTDTSGRGVGMGAVKTAVEAAGGTIQVSSTVGKGTIFEITVPLRAETKLKAASPKGLAA